MMYLLIGKSGSGKDYIANKLCETLSLTRVDSRTTRKKRKGIDRHIFVSNEQADKEFDRAVAKTVFDGNRYYVLEEDLIGKDIYIIDLEGIKSLKGKEIDYKVLYIDTSWFIRMINMRKRGDTWKAIFLRLKHDRAAYKGIKSEADYIFKNSNAVYDFISTIYKL